MSFDRVPSKSVVMDWNPHQLADYMKKLNLSGCDKVIMKCSINGQRFLNMTENDHQKFPKIHAPLISKICSEINRKEEKRRFFTKRTAAPKYEPAMPQEDQPWGPDEFDEGSDEDYENPDAEEDDGSGGDYESPTEDVGLEDSDNGYESPPSEAPEEIPHQLRAAKPLADGEYIDSTPHRNTARSHPPPTTQRPGAGPPIPSASHPSLLQPPPPRREQSPQHPGRITGKLPATSSNAAPAPPVDRRRKPTKLDRTRLAESPIPATKLNTTNMPAPHSWRPQAEERGPDPPRMPKPPLPVSSSVSRSSSSVGRAPLNNNRYVPDARNEVQDDVPMSKPYNSNTFPRPGHPRAVLPGLSLHSDGFPPNIASTASLPSKLQALQASISPRSSPRIVPDRHIMPPPPPMQASIPPPADLEDEQDLNPQWYVGQVTRGQAEGCLRQVNMDGAFLVRDSSKRSSIQPYTLMVLYQDKVYNIQIRCEQNEFLLGTGLKVSETYPMVAHIIAHYRQSPLLLIDAKNRGSGQQSQCPLIYPAGGALASLYPSF
ncbi:lymphocyte cytosolic protein 2 isoform X2 [Oncorhynchus kisutch]|uniref:lymphocyte cytosolic protein 2 isoform X2 n=1 Tax=Oncorhynchus kisutch TaxID=8019 RepID=UPI0009A04BA2|nr:lymphocyte cytosolic protein 2 isoform X2 [Oncorhynchus kisutch]